MRWHGNNAKIRTVFSNKLRDNINALLARSKVADEQQTQFFTEAEIDDLKKRVDDAHDAAVEAETVAREDLDYLVCLGKNWNDYQARPHMLQELNSMLIRVDRVKLREAAVALQRREWQLDQLDLDAARRDLEAKQSDIAKAERKLAEDTKKVEETEAELLEAGG